MPVIDFDKLETQADGTLSRYTVKADGRDDEGFVYETDIVFVIEGTQDARIVQSIVPGAEDVWTRASAEDDDWKFNTTVTPDLIGTRAVLTNAKLDHKGIEGACDVKSVRLRASKRATTLTVKLVFGGQTAAQASALAGLLRSAVSLSLSRDQQVLPFPTTSVQPKTGDLVVAFDGGTAFTGRLLQSDDSVLVLEDFDREYRVDPGSVSSVIRLDGDVAALRRSYKTRCQRRNLTASWEAIVLALGQDNGAVTRGSASVVLTAETIEKAVALLESGDELLPPEPSGHIEPEAVQA